MLMFRIVTCLYLAVFAYYLLLLCLDELEKRCRPPQEVWIVKIVMTIKTLVGYPPPEPPWWDAVCPWVSGRQHMVETLEIVFSDLGIVLMAAVLPGLALVVGFGKKVPVRDIARQRGDIWALKVSYRMVRTVLSKSMAVRCVSDPKVEEINHTPKLDDFTVMYRKILLGPIEKCYEALRILILNAFIALSIPPMEVTWAFDKNQHGHPTLMVAQTTAFRVRVFTGPHGLEIHVLHLGGLLGKHEGKTLRYMDKRQYVAKYTGIEQVEAQRVLVSGKGWADLNIVR